jgi:hypothetical protein
MKKKYAIRNIWMNKKMGISRNLVLRVLCLKSSMPVQAPKGPKKPISRSLDSGILQLPLLLFNLSTPKATKEIAFAVSRRICRNNI